MSKRKCFEAEASSLFQWNVGACVLHAVYFLVVLVLAIINSGGSLQAELTTDFRLYDAGAVGPPEAGFFSVEPVSLGFYQLVWLELPFPLITALFHGLLAFYAPMRKRYTRLALLEGRNPYRWLEYSITASFMTWVIMQLAGLTNLLTLVLGAVVCNVALQYQGHFMERLNPLPARKQGKVDWTPTVVGWIIFVGQWLLIFAYFFAAIGSGAERTPGFVYGIVFGLFGLFSLFGVVQLLHFLRVGFLASAYQVERAYIVLSFAAKFTLDLVLILGILGTRIP